MKYKLDDDRKGFHLWFGEAEFQKMLSDSVSVGVSLDEYLSDMVLYGVTDQVAKAVRSGRQDNIPEVTFERLPSSAFSSRKR
jgi:hypothetical protein